MYYFSVYCKMIKALKLTEDSFVSKFIIIIITFKFILVVPGLNSGKQAPYLWLVGSLVAAHRLL